MRSLSTTRPGPLLKDQIPIRTFTDWNDDRVGFLEADSVAHCGTSMAGTFLNSLVLTDIKTGWTECKALLYKDQDFIVQAFCDVRERLSFPILGLDTDNGSEFITNKLFSYCDQEEITFTRSRPYKKNDQCFVEQKNGHIVRRLVGYDRYEGLSPMKRKLLERQDGKCPACGLGFSVVDVVVLHHKDKNQDNFALSNLAILHGHCHETVHGTRVRGRRRRGTV